MQRGESFFFLDIKSKIVKVFLTSLQPAEQIIELDSFITSDS